MTSNDEEVSHDSPSTSETYEQFLKIIKHHNVTFDTVIQEHNESLMKAKCKLIVYPTSIDLDESVPYCQDIIDASTSEPNIRDIERELYTFYSTSNNDHLFTHLFLKVHHYDEMTHKDIFNLRYDKILVHGRKRIRDIGLCRSIHETIIHKNLQYFIISIS
ncbi:hypothetical protein SFRURICE_003517 [Spodoptera frugiperda]|nr:hypothetical protein SFRURICE_003517 [Spodoptera frugiperda]